MPKLKTPPFVPLRGNLRKIRALLRESSAQASDQQLLAVFLAAGSTRHASRRWPKKVWTAMELAEELYAAGGWHLTGLVRKIRAGEIDLGRFGLGKRSGSRLAAAIGLAYRWGHGSLADEIRIRGGSLAELGEQIFFQQGEATDAELIALLMGTDPQDGNRARLLLEVFRGPQEFVGTLTHDRLQHVLDEVYSRPEIREYKPEFEVIEQYRLLSAAMLARRYRAQAEVRCEAWQPGALGLDSMELVKLLDPASPLDGELRASLIALMRSQPRFEGDFARLDRLARDAGTESYRQAADLHRMFEVLRQRRQWTDPAVVLGGQVPYGGLLAIAEARIARAAEPPARILELRALLREAEQAATAQPAADFATALIELGVSETGADKALEQARRSYLARCVPGEKVSGTGSGGTVGMSAEAFEGTLTDLYVPRRKKR